MEKIDEKKGETSKVEIKSEIVAEKSTGNYRKCRSSSSSNVTSRSRSRSRGYHSSRKSRNHRKRSRRSRSRSRRRSYSRSPSYHRRIRYYGSRENPFKSRVVGIFGLSSVTNEVKLIEIFERFGTIEHVSIVHDAKTGNSRGFGFIYYTQIDQASMARKECNGMLLDGKRIRVDYSITKRAHTPTPGLLIVLFMSNLN